MEPLGKPRSMWDNIIEADSKLESFKGLRFDFRLGDLWVLEGLVAEWVHFIFFGWAIWEV